MRKKVQVMAEKKKSTVKCGDCQAERDDCVVLDGATLCPPCVVEWVNGRDYDELARVEADTLPPESAPSV